MVYTPSELDEYMISILLAFLSTRSKSAVSWSREFRYNMRRARGAQMLLN